MIRRLSGRVIEANTSQVVIDVNGVGYLVNTSLPGTQLAQDCDVTLWIHTAVRETALDLYGFTNQKELEVFELLLTVPKIGPKSAAQILANASVELLYEAVSKEDPSYLSKMSGIGKKTAENIVVGLKNKLNDQVTTSETHSATTSNLTSIQSDTIDALIALGYPPAEARKAALSLPIDINSTNEAVTLALRQLQ